MSRYDYQIAKELISDDHVSPTSLIFALIVKAPEKFKHIRELWPDICREYWDRHYGVDGFLRGESLDADKVYQQRDMEGLYQAQTTKDRLRFAGKRRAS